MRWILAVITLLVLVWIVPDLIGGTTDFLEHFNAYLVGASIGLYQSYSPEMLNKFGITIMGLTTILGIYATRKKTKYIIDKSETSDISVTSRFLFGHYKLLILLLLFTSFIGVFITYSGLENFYYYSWQSYNRASPVMWNLIWIGISLIIPCLLTAFFTGPIFWKNKLVSILDKEKSL